MIRKIENWELKNLLFVPESSRVVFEEQSWLSSGVRFLISVCVLSSHERYSCRTTVFSHPLISSHFVVKIVDFFFSW